MLLALPGAAAVYGLVSGIRIIITFFHNYQVVAPVEEHVARAPHWIYTRKMQLEVLQLGPALVIACLAR